MSDQLEPRMPIPTYPDTAREYLDAARRYRELARQLADQLAKLKGRK